MNPSEQQTEFFEPPSVTTEAIHVTGPELAPMLERLRREGAEVVALNVVCVSSYEVHIQRRHGMTGNQ